MKSALAIYAILATLALCYGCGTQAVKQTSSEDNSLTLVMPTDSTPQTKIDTIKLGRLLEGEVVTTTFQLKNNSQKPLVITSTVTGCGCTSVKYNTAPIPPQQSTPITLTFDSKGRYGTQIKTIEIISADHQVGKIIITGQVAEQ